MRVLFVLLIVLCSSCWCHVQEVDTSPVCPCERSAILLRDIKELELTQGLFTVSRRLPAIAQIECIGGSAKGSGKEPHSVRCVNLGHKWGTSV
jgi:hypothetical protein